MKSYKDCQPAWNPLGSSQAIFPSTAWQSTFWNPPQRKSQNSYNLLYTMSSIHSKFTNHTKKQNMNKPTGNPDIGIV